MNRCNSTHHRERDDYCGNPAEQPDDQSDSTEQFPGDHKKGQSRRKVHIFGERAHAPGKTGSAVPPQHFLSAVAKEYDSQDDASDPHDPVKREYLVDFRSSVVLLNSQFPPQAAAVDGVTIFHSMMVQRLAEPASNRRSWRSMEYFGASIQTRKAGHRHQTRSRASIMAEIAITIRLIIVWSSPAVDHIVSARIRPGRAADLR